MADTDNRGRVSVVRDAIQTQLWPLPMIGVSLALILGIALPLLDLRVDGALPAGSTIYLFSGDPDAARTVLSAVSGSLITVTSLTFSLTVVTLQLASSQFSPRLLRTFSRDRVVHVTLALFLGTFIFSLMVLRTVRDGGDTDPDFVPQLSVTCSVLLTLVSVIALVLFLAHLAKQIRVESINDRVHHEASDTLRRVLQPRQERSATTYDLPSPPPGAMPLLSHDSGFLVSVDGRTLLDAAVEADAIVIIDGFPGATMVAGTPIGRAWPTGPHPLSEKVVSRLGDQVAQAIQAGPERTAAQDVAFGLRQLTDVANKALSPGINDPTTAVHALGHISAVLCEAAGYQLGPKLIRDSNDQIRVVLHRPGFGDLLDDAIAQPRRFASDSPNVLHRIAQLLREVGWHVSDPHEQQTVRRQIDRLEHTIDDADFDETDTRGLKHAVRQARAAITGQWYG